MSRNLDQSLAKLSRKNNASKPEHPVHLLSDEATGDLFLIYSTESGVDVEFKYSGDTLWMTQAQIAELFGRDVTTISRHITNIVTEGELDEMTSLRKMQRSHGRPAIIYNLDMIISVGYRVSSKQATLFRRWATDKLVQFATKGFVIDRQRLGSPDDQNHFKELRDVIRDIRASEANIYREVRTICAMCQDYDPKSETSRNIFTLVQNTLLWASVSMTAPEIIINRAESRAENMGLTNWPKRNIRKQDVSVAHNYLAEPEIKRKNLLTTMLLDYFESRLDQEKLTTLDQLKSELIRFIQFNEYPLLKGHGSVKRTDADKYVHKHYKIFAEKRRALRHEIP